jgi:hypothetical protein
MTIDLGTPHDGCRRNNQYKAKRLHNQPPATILIINRIKGIITAQAI